MLKSRTTFTGNSTKTKTNNKTFVCVLLICDLKIVDLSSGRGATRTLSPCRKGFTDPTATNYRLLSQNNLVKNPSFLF